MSALRNAARVAMVVGAAGSLALMLWLGRRNPSSFLMFLFAGWVTLPFVAVGAAERVSQRWAPKVGAILDVLALVFALVAVAVYGAVALGVLRPRTAAPFLLVPLASLVVLAIVVGRAELAARAHTSG